MKEERTRANTDVESSGHRHRDVLREHLFASYIVAFGALVIAAAFAAQLVLSTFGGNPTGLLRVAETNAAIAESQIGSDVIRSGQKGHDGHYFFQVAIDPLIRSDLVKATFDDLPHRVSRIGYPMVASLGTILPPRWLPWSLIVTNVVLLGVGSWFCALICSRLHVNPLWGLLFLVNPGFSYSLGLNGATIFASVALLGGLYGLAAGRRSLGLAFLALAVLGRETYLLAAVAAVLFTWRRDWRLIFTGLVSVSLPYVLVRLFFEWWFRDEVTSAAAVSRNFDWPGVGFVRASDAWFEASGLALVAIVTTAVAMFLLVGFALLRPRIWSIAGVAFVPLVVVASEDVLAAAFDFSRVFAPCVTLAVLGVLEWRGSREPGIPLNHRKSVQERSIHPDTLD